jgi:hypothetical protein
MTIDITEHDRYVAKVNNLVASGREDLVDEVAEEYALDEPSGREAFWSPTRSEWIVRELLRD